LVWRLLICPASLLGGVEVSDLVTVTFDDLPNRRRLTVQDIRT